MYSNPSNFVFPACSKRRLKAWRLVPWNVCAQWQGCTQQGLRAHPVPLAGSAAPACPCGRTPKKNMPLRMWFLKETNSLQIIRGKDTRGQVLNANTNVQGFLEGRMMCGCACVCARALTLHLAALSREPREIMCSPVKRKNGVA